MDAHLFAEAATVLAQDGGAAGLLSTDVLLKIAGTVLSAGGVASGAWWLASRNSQQQLRHLRRKSDHYQELHADAAKERDTQLAMSAKLQQEYAATTARLTELTGRAEALYKAAHQWKAYAGKLETGRKGWETELTRLRSVVDDLTAAKLKAEGEASQTTAALELQRAVTARAEQRMRRALKLEGQLWSAKALQGRPKFRELDRRQRAIISVLNLKGGVGKTTVTAHLGAALARQGYRVLVVDLDLQGSLTTLLLPQDKISQLFADNRLAQHFFEKSSEDSRTRITSFAQQVFSLPEGGSLSVVGTTDALAYAELNLTMRWLLQSGSRDTRFLLRKALHLQSAGKLYDIVLLDCPPMVNISCVNALAASDYVLIPTSLSQKSIERVPLLLNRLLRNEKFRRFVNHDIRVLGLVANRTYREKLTGEETDKWDKLATRCRDVYGQPVKRFETTIPQFQKEIRESEAEFGPHDPTSRLGDVFARLANDFVRELPSECRRLAKAPQ